jgi:hypothetical protein
MSAVVEPRQESQLATMAITPMEMLSRAVERGADLEYLKQLMELEEKWRAAQAKRAYITAFALFKKNMPDVVKDMLNKQYGSDYSSLANLVNTTNRVLGEYGLNARWDPDQSEGIKVTCILSHIDGHSEQVSLKGPPDNSGQKNALQQIKSTLTYLEGATFQAITGVVARSASADDDGNGAGGKPGNRPAEAATPAGYDDWKADMRALADEGTAKLQDAWQKSSDEFRRYVVKHDELWWGETKRKAAKVAQ